MSTPPRVDLPDGLVLERWPIGSGERAVMRTDLEGVQEWAVLVPGFTGSKEDFIAVLPLLREAGIGAVAYDQRGQFESDGSDDPRDYRLEAFAADLGAMIDLAADRFGLTETPHLVGHSFGGLVSQCALVIGTARPASFVALCSGPGALPESRWTSLPELVSSLPETGLDEVWERRQELDRLADKPVPAPDIQAFLERRWLANSPVQLRQAALILMEQPSLTPQVRRAVDAGLAMTVMWGELDNAWPIEDQVRMAAELGVPAVEIPGSAHSPNADNPAALLEHLIEAWHR